MLLCIPQFLPLPLFIITIIFVIILNILVIDFMILFD